MIGDAQHATSGATIRYTTDGSTPTTSSPIYSGPIPVSQTTTIQAMAMASGMTNSNVASATYTIQQQVATPTFSPAAGTYIGIGDGDDQHATSGATIRYTTDGTTPTTSSPIYTGPITVYAEPDDPGDGDGERDGSTAPWPAPPTRCRRRDADVQPAWWNVSAEPDRVDLDATPGATIHYTTDGSTPTTSSRVYTGPILLLPLTTTTIKAIAVAPGQSQSVVASATYRVVL